MKWPRMLDEKWSDLRTSKRLNWKWDVQFRILEQYKKPWNSRNLARDDEIERWGQQKSGWTVWWSQMAVIRSRIAVPVSFNDFVSNIISIRYCRSQILGQLLQRNPAIQRHEILRYHYLESFFRSTVNEQRISFKSDVILKTFANNSVSDCVGWNTLLIGMW
jgi:argonaute-like protein implicated in RNA metabolism and viral defense